MKFKCTIEIEVERVEGKFAPKSDIQECLEYSVENADPVSIEGVGADGESYYEVTSWEVTWE